MTPERITSWFYEGCPPELARAAWDRYNRATHTAPRSSPAATGRRMMDELRPRGMAPRESVAYWPAIATTPNTVTDLSFVRPLTDNERGRRYLHAYDRNGQYLAACSSLELGLGGLEHLSGDAARAAVDHTPPGYWACHLVNGTNKWIGTPELTALVERGAVDDIQGAWVWRRHGRALRHWYERLRDARAVLMHDESEAGQLAYGALKRTYRESIGWLCGYWFNPDDERFRPETGGHLSPDFRPDWRHMIVSQARANMRRAIDEMESWGTPAVACHIDQVYIVSDEPDAAQAVSGLVLGDTLGKWKIRYEGVPAAVWLPVFDSARPRALALDDACDEWSAD